MMSTNIENQDTIIFLIRHTKTKSAGISHAFVSILISSFVSSDHFGYLLM